MRIFCSLPVACLWQRRAGCRRHRCQRRLRFAACLGARAECRKGQSGRSLCCRWPFCVSPCRTRMVTAGWLSAAVEKTCFFWVGIVVLRSTRGVMTPPRVSIPKSQRGDVEQEHIFDVAGQERRLGWRRRRRRLHRG